MVKGVTAGQGLKTYCLSVAEQPTTGIPTSVITTAPNFISHLVTAQHNAAHFVADIHPMLSNNVAHIISYSNQWKSFGPYFKEYFMKGETDAVVSGLTMVQKRLATYQQNCKATRLALVEFQKLVATDAGHFKTDLTKLMSAESGLPSIIEADNRKIDAQQEVTNQAIGMICGGAAAAVVGGLMVIGGTVEAAFTAGTSIPVAVAGVAVAGGGIALIVLGSEALDKASHEIAAAQTEIATLNQSISHLKCFDGIATGLASSCSTAVTSVSTLENQWEFLADDLDNVIFDVKQAKTSATLPWFPASIDTAVADWKQLGRIASCAQLSLADMKMSKVDMSGKFGSLLNGLPAKDAQDIRDAEKKKNDARHGNLKVVGGTDTTATRAA